MPKAPEKVTKTKAPAKAPSKDARPIIMISVDHLKPYEKNAKVHDEEQVQKIANSIEKFGFRGNISITEDDTIINGHGRVLACKLLKYKTIPCVVEKGMTEDEIKAFRLADNKTNEGGYDATLLSQELAELSKSEEMDMAMFFSEKELSFSIDDLGEIDGDGISEDLKNEVDAIADSTSNLVDEADALVHKIQAAFEFDKVGSEGFRMIRKLMMLAESETKLVGEKALIAYTKDFLGL
jgi:hypothetical protein